MRTKLLSVLVISAAFIVPSVALADPPADRCGLSDDPPPVVDFTSPGSFNKFEKADRVPPNELSGQLVAAETHERNADRKLTCPPPGLVP